MEKKYQDAASRVINNCLNLAALILSAEQVRSRFYAASALADTVCDRIGFSAAYAVPEEVEQQEAVYAALRKGRRVYKDAAERTVFWEGLGQPIINGLSGLLEGQWSAPQRAASITPEEFLAREERAILFLGNLRKLRDVLRDDAQRLRRAHSVIAAEAKKGFGSAVKRQRMLLAIRSAAPFELGPIGIGAAGLQIAIGRLQDNVQAELERADLAGTCLCFLEAEAKTLVSQMAHKRANQASKAYNALELGGLFANGEGGDIPAFYPKTARAVIFGAMRLASLTLGAEKMAESFWAMASLEGSAVAAEAAAVADELANFGGNVWNGALRGSDTTGTVEERVPGLRDVLFFTTQPALPRLAPVPPAPADLTPEAFLREVRSICKWLSAMARLRKGLGFDREAMARARVDVSHAYECSFGTDEQRRQALLSVYKYATWEIYVAGEALKSLTFTTHILRERLERALAQD